MLILGRAPLLAKYVRMLRHVSYNFLMMILLYGALLLAFAISFNIILQPTEADKVRDRVGSDFFFFFFSFSSHFFSFCFSSL